MTITARHALVTGGSRGIGRGIALKLADHGVHVAINYLRDEASAKATLEQVRCARGRRIHRSSRRQPAGGRRAPVQPRRKRVRQPRHLRRQCARRGRHVLRAADVHSASSKWDAAMDSQARAFLVGVQKARETDARRRPHHRHHLHARRRSMAAGSRGWPWAPPSPRSRRCAATSRWRSHRAASPSTPSAPAGPKTAC